MQMEPMIRDSSELVLKKFESIANTGKSLNMTKYVILAFRSCHSLFIEVSLYICTMSWTLIQG